MGDGRADHRRLYRHAGLTDLEEEPEHEGERRPGGVAAAGHRVGPEDHVGLAQPP